MNNDLISREALLKAAKSPCENCKETMKSWCEHCCPVNDFVDIIDNAPTVDLISPTINVNISEETKQKLIEELQKPHKLLALPEPEVAFERPQGEWIIVKDKKYGDNVKCPFCGKEIAGSDLNYCAKCGAKMKDGAE